MSIGKIANRRWVGSGDNKHQIVHIILLPTYSKDKYNDLLPKQYKTTIGSGSTIWAESGHELEVINEGAEYPYLAAKSIDTGNVYGKVTNDDKEALSWIRKVAWDLFPSRFKQIIPIYGIAATAEWGAKWQPLKDRLDSAQHASEAAKILREVREQNNLPGIVTEASNTTVKEGLSITAQAAKNEGKEALKEAAKQIKTEVKDAWDDISPLWKTGLIGGGIILVAVVISEKVK